MASKNRFDIEYTVRPDGLAILTIRDKVRKPSGKCYLFSQTMEEESEELLFRTLKRLSEDLPFHYYNQEREPYGKCRRCDGKEEK